eukprot:gene2501-3286_t
MNYLDFEEPIRILEEELEKAKQIAENAGIEGLATITELQEKIAATRKHIFDNLSAWQKVQVSRHPDRPYVLQHFNYLSDNTFVELHGDRNVKDDKAMVGGLGKIDGQSFMLIGQQKGINTKMRQLRNFGMASPE